MTESDFLAACESEGIVLLRLPLPIYGCYLRRRGTPIIMIDSRLRGFLRLHVMFHELGHYFLHTTKSPPELAKEAASALREKKEDEAEAFAAVALIPEPLLNAPRLHPRRQTDSFRKLLKVRRRVLKKYGV